ncbi:MAG: lysophospholipid acyltransferase family protein [Candidatus Limnocylindria bacterium]
MTTGAAVGDRPLQPVAREPAAGAFATTPGERKRERLAYWGYRAAEAVLQRLPRAALLPLSAAAATGVFAIAPEKRALTQDNLARPLRLPADHPRVRRAALRAFRNYGKYLIDMMRLPALDDAAVDDLVRIENIESLTQARAPGKGVLLCCVHVGGMDVIGPALKRHGQRMHVVADDTSYGRLFEHLRAVRQRHEIHLIPWRNLRQLFRALRDGENLVLFCDWGYRSGDVPVELFGEPTTFPAGPATLAAKSGAPMLPVHVRRTRDDRFVARGLPLVRAAATDPAELYRATQQLADALSSVIAADPGQWYIFRHIWPQTDVERDFARTALEAARRGDDWTRLRPG